MSSRLDRIKEWNEIARSVSYSVQSLASRLNVSERQLHRYFRDHFGDSPRRFLETLRMNDASQALSEGGSVKEVAFRLRFKQASHFSRVFKRTRGRVPSNHTTNDGDERKNVRNGYEMSELDTRIEFPGTRECATSLPVEIQSPR